MAMVADRQPQQQEQKKPPGQQPQQQGGCKYYCRICKKGFGCGRALGGHMRAHGINDDLITAVQAEASSDADAAPTRMYSLRSNPSRLKSCRVCENCGKEFSSWKSFLEHGKCGEEEDDDDDEYPDVDPDEMEDEEYDDEDGEASMLSSPASEGGDYGEDHEAERRDRGWSKGKRTKRCKVMTIGAGGSSSNYNNANNNISPSSEEEDLAASCLVMLSAARVDTALVLMDQTEESCASASREEDNHHRKHQFAADRSHLPETTFIDVRPPRPFLHHASTATPAMATKGGFECKACKRVFSSHQALGGHRASHKKVKGCFAAKLDGTGGSGVSTMPVADEPPLSTDDESAIPTTADYTTKMAIVPFESAPLDVAPLRKKAKVHECTICHRIFTSGQALGGHKRCHWLTSNNGAPGAAPPDAAYLGKLEHLIPMFEKAVPVDSTNLDLNLPISAAAAAFEDIKGGLTLELPTALCLQPMADVAHRNVNNNNCAATINNTNKNKRGTRDSDNANDGYFDQDVEDEAESKIKLAKLSELKDVSAGGGSSPWLQVGIGSGSNDGGIQP